MPVEDHPIHPSTQKGADFRYGCHDRKPFAQSYYAPNRQAGTNGHQPTFWIERVRVEFRMRRDCRYDLAKTDPACAGCIWMTQ